MRRRFMSTTRLASVVVFVAMGLFISVEQALGQTTEFTYQGNLTNAGSPANGNFDFEFRVFDAPTGGAQIPNFEVVRSNVPVVNGLFTVALDFSNSFSGTDRWLEIRVRTAGGGGFTILDPRQKLGSTPYAVRSLTATNAVNATNATNADTAQNALQLGGVAANQYVVTTDPRMTDDRAPTAGSSNYIQNQNAGAQAATNFNISGNGTVGGTLSGSVVSSATQFNIGAERVLSIQGTDNVFAGVGAGQANTTGISNAFFGRDAGQANTTGSNNAFFGRIAGFANTTGSQNAFFGRSAGFANTTGSTNAFFGGSAGLANTTGFQNAFFGANAGKDNTTGNSNAFFGRDAGLNNTTGFENAFFGRDAGFANTTGFENSFFGTSSGTANTTGSNNTLIGQSTNVASGNLTFATAIGAGAVVTSSNRIQIGRAGLDAVRLGTLSSSSSTQLCIITATNTIAACSSSIRYKENVKPFSAGLNLVKRLNPVTYDWIEQKEPDLGLIAEEVAEVEPLLVTYNHKGEIQGVKYDQITLALINAVKEQQDEIIGLRTVLREQQNRIEKQQRQMTALIQYICAADPKAAVCTEEK